MASITDTGYSLQSQNDWFSAEQQLYLDIDPNWNLDPSTPDGLKMAHDSEVFSALDETLQQAYNSKDPNKATGLDLDILCALSGITRSAGTASTVSLTLSGVAGSIIPGSTRFDDTNGNRWSLDKTWTLDSTGTATGDATCTVVGDIEASPGTITELVDTIGGLTGVTNATAATPGTAVESDASLRARRNLMVGQPGSNQVDSMTGSIFGVDGVRRVKIYENDTPSASESDDNPYSLPANSISPIVDGGTDDDVAMAIYLKKNPGVMLNQAGTGVSVVVTSPTYATNTKTIRFSRPVYVDMVLVIEIKSDGTLPSQDVLQTEIQTAFTEFTNGDLVPTEYGFKQNGFGIGENVPYSTVQTPVNAVIGKYGNSYINSLTLNGGTANIEIAFNELSRWTTSNITVSII
jgi:uncharacterized phage protein gp47/JayE